MAGALVKTVMNIHSGETVSCGLSVPVIDAGTQANNRHGSSYDCLRALVMLIHHKLNRCPKLRFTIHLVDCHREYPVMVTDGSVICTRYGDNLYLFGVEVLLVWWLLRWRLQICCAK